MHTYPTVDPMACGCVRLSPEGLGDSSALTPPDPAGDPSPPCPPPPVMVALPLPSSALPTSCQQGGGDLQDSIRASHINRHARATPSWPHLGYEHTRPPPATAIS